MQHLNRLVLVLALCLSYIALECSGFLFEEYHWKDFEGTIPKDAFVAGQDATGAPIYVAQVFYGNKLLPGKIYENDDKAYYAWGYEMTATKDIQILCTEKPERFTWIKVSKNEIHQLYNQRLVKGGWESGYDLYIGRAFHQHQTLPGRVRVAGPPAANKGLYVSSDKKEIIFPEFEILAYVPETNGTEVRYCSKRIVITKP